jgi:hypothetical protein
VHILSTFYQFCSHRDQPIGFSTKSIKYLVQFQTDEISGKIHHHRMTPVIKKETATLTQKFPAASQTSNYKFVDFKMGFVVAAPKVSKNKHKCVSKKLIPSFNPPPRKTHSIVQPHIISSSIIIINKIPLALFFIFNIALV